jgi:hypothetical protein
MSLKIENSRHVAKSRSVCMALYSLISLQISFESCMYVLKAKNAS